MSFKFESLEVWKLSLDYIDLVYELAGHLPPSQDYNLKSQIKRAATSVALNIAEGSTGQTDPEQARLLGMAIRSLLETVACQHIISRRNYISDPSLLRRTYKDAEALTIKLQAMRKAIAPQQSWLREEPDVYEVDNVFAIEDES